MSDKNNRTPLSQYRADAWSALDGNRGSALGLTLTALLFGGVGRGSFRRFFVLLGSAVYLVCCIMAFADSSVVPYIDKAHRYVDKAYSAVYDLLSRVFPDMSATLGVDAPHFKALLEVVFVVAVCGFSLFLFWSLFGEAVYVGRCRWHLDRLEGIPSDRGTLFSAFGSHFWKSFLLRLTRAILVFLWSLLLVVPGIVAAYRYSMADWVLAENPNMRVRDVLRESARMMQHRKWRYFLLQLSFLGWHLFAVASLGIQYVWLLPYIHQTKTQFYDDVSGRRSIRDSLDTARLLSEDGTGASDLWQESAPADLQKTAAAADIEPQEETAENAAVTVGE